MGNRFNDVVTTDNGLRNVRFLLAQQIQVVDTLGKAGRDTADALLLLRKLMDIETAMVARQRPAQRSAGSMVAAA